MTVIKSYHYNYIFGGFTTAQWNQNVNKYVYDSDAFIFSLVNVYNTPVKMSIINSKHAIYSNFNYGPTFGAGHDIELKHNSNIAFSGFSYIESYQLPSFVSERSTFLAGSSSFLADEIEVYALNGRYTNIIYIWLYIIYIIIK